MSVPEPRRQQVYKPGDNAPVSGIYTAVHEVHRTQHEILAIRGEQFPSCRGCKDQVRFYLTAPVTHMTHDFDLTGPTGRTSQRSARAAKSSGR